MEFDPQQIEVVTGNLLVGSPLIISFTSLKNEIRRIHWIQGFNVNSLAGAINFTLTPPGGKAGGLVNLVVDAPFPANDKFSWPNYDETESVLDVQFVDLLAGWSLVVAFTGGSDPKFGEVIVGYERITDDRIKAMYGSAAELNVETGMVTYPGIGSAERNISLVRTV